MASGQEAQSSFDKFRVFYERYFPNDEYSVNANGFRAGANGTLDILEKLARGAAHQGCLDTAGKRVPFCLTAEEMPYVPKVEGVTYPSAYDIHGNATAWSESDHSELKFSAFVSLLVQIMGTLHESGKIQGTVSEGSCALGSPFQDSRDQGFSGSHDYRYQNESCIYYFANDGYRKHINTFLKAMASLNETKQIGDNKVEPEYNTAALINQLIETAPGKRDGVLIRFLRDFNVGNMPYFKDEIQDLVRQNLESILGGFELLSKDGGASSNLNKLRYFLTENVIREGVFGTNYLGGVVNDPVSGLASDTSKEPLLMLKDDLLPYLRRMTSDEGLKTALIDGMDVLNNFLTATDKEPFDITSASIEKFLGLLPKVLNKRNSDGSLFLENAIQKAYDSGFHDPDQIYALNIWEKLPELASFVKAIFNYDVEAELLSEFFGDHRCGGGPFYDVNGNGSFDDSWFTFHPGAYQTVGNQCDLRSDNKEDYYKPSRYQLNIHYLSHRVNEAMKDMSSDDVESALDTLYELPDLTEKITELKNEAITDFMEKSFQEFGRDLDSSGSVDAPIEYIDLNGDGQYGEFTPNEAAAFAQDTLHEYLLEEKSGKMVPNQILKGILTITNVSLNPRNGECSSGGGVRESAINACSYITPSLIGFMSDISKNLKFSLEDLKAFKNLAGNLTYDKKNARPTYLLNTLSGSLAPVMLAFRGKYDKLLDVLHYGLQPDGFITFMDDSFVLPEGYETIDLLADFRTLLNTKAMREHDKPGTFWWEFGDMIGSFADIAARQHGYSWETKEDYYKRISEIFTKTEDEFSLKE